MSEETEIHSLEVQLGSLDAEWERLDSQGGMEIRQEEIAQEAKQLEEKLNRLKRKHHA